MTFRDLGGKWDDEVYNWQMSSLGDERDRDREWGDWGFVPFVILLAALTLTVLVLAVV